MSRTPDRARFVTAAQRDAGDAATAARDAVTAANKFKAEVTRLSLPDAAIEASGVEIARTPAEDDSKPSAPRFSANASVSVETSSFDGIANAMRIAAAEGMDAVAPMEAFLAPATRDALVLECLPKAAADARARASALLRGLGASLGPIRKIENVATDNPGPVRPMGAMRMAAAALPMPTPSVSAGPQVVSVSVNVTFAIAP